MAKTDYGAEIKDSMKPKTDSGRPKSDSGKPVTGNPTANKPIGPGPSQKPPDMHYSGAMPHAQQSAMGNSDEQVRMAHAAGIAHAILGGRKMM